MNRYQFEDLISDYIENKLPVIHLCDSAGGFLPLQSELFPDKYMAGRMFRNQCVLSKMNIKLSILSRVLYLVSLACHLAYFVFNCPSFH